MGARVVSYLMTIGVLNWLVLRLIKSIVIVNHLDHILGRIIGVKGTGGGTAKKN